MLQKGDLETIEMNRSNLEPPAIRIDDNHER